MVHLGSGVALPSISYHVLLELVHNLVLWLDNARWLDLFLLRVLLWLVLDFLIFNSFPLLLFLPLSLSLLLFLSHEVLLGLLDLLLEPSIACVQFHVVDERVACGDSDCHETGLVSLASHFVHDLIVARDLLFVSCQHLRNAVDGGVCHKLFKLSMQ